MAELFSPEWMQAYKDQWNAEPELADALAKINFNSAIAYGWKEIDELKKARAISPKGIIGINSMVATRDHEMQVRTAAEQGIDLVISGAGLPLNLPEYTADYPDIALVPIISSLRAAQIICQKWERKYGRLPDAFVVENPALKNAFASAAIANSPALEKRCLASCLQVCKCRDTQETYCIIQALDRAARGDVENGLIFAGSNAGRAQSMMSVAQLIQELIS
jgi:NAD(P)H-dependent flavin oxidoreductase YrpB (nitropropane dioxygenase family)